MGNHTLDRLHRLPGSDHTLRHRQREHVQGAGEVHTERPGSGAQVAVIRDESAAPLQCQAQGSRVRAREARVRGNTPEHGVVPDAANGDRLPQEELFEEEAFRMTGGTCLASDLIPDFLRHDD